MHFLAQEKACIWVPSYIFSHSPMSDVTKRSTIILKKESDEKEIKEEVTVGSKSYIYMECLFLCYSFPKLPQNQLKSWYCLMFVCYHIHTFI